VKKSRKTNLNTIEHSAKVFFQWALYPEMDEKGYLKLLKADGRKKKLLHSPAYKREIVCSELLINIIYVKIHRAISNKSSLFSI
jgi:hypothetical protein